MLKSPLFNEAGAGEGGSGGGALAGLDAAQGAYGSKNAFPPSSPTSAPVSSEPAPSAVTDPAPSALEPKPTAKAGRKGLANIIQNPEPPTEPTSPIEPTEIPKDQKAWQELKAHEKWRREHEPKLTEWQKKAEEAEQRQKDWEAKQSRFEELENKVAAFDVQSTAEYQNEVVIPEQEQFKIIDDYIAYAEVDVSEVKAALDEPNRFHRAKKLREVLSKSGEEIPASAEAEILTAWSKVQEIHGRRDELLAKATQLRDQFKTKDETVRLEQEKAKQIEFQNAAKEVTTQLRTVLKPYLNDDLVDDSGNKFSLDDFESITPSTSPNDIAYNEQAGYLLPFFKTKVEALTKELSELRAERKERAAIGSPTGRPRENSPSPDSGVSLADAQAQQLQFTSVRR